MTRINETRNVCSGYKKNRALKHKLDDVYIAYCMNITLERKGKKYTHPGVLSRTVRQVQRRVHLYIAGRQAWRFVAPFQTGIPLYPGVAIMNFLFDLYMYLLNKS